MANLESFLTSAWNDIVHGGRRGADDCSGFVISAARRLGVALPVMDADHLIETMQRDTPRWDNLGVGATGLRQATTDARIGAFVIVAATSKELGQTHGHLALVLPVMRGDVPLVYCGSLISGLQSKGDKRLSDVFRRTSFGVLHYYEARNAVIPRYGDGG